jgi:hypothetical protein
VVIGPSVVGVTVVVVRLVVAVACLVVLVGLAAVVVVWMVVVVAVAVVVVATVVVVVDDLVGDEEVGASVTKVTTGSVVETSELVEPGVEVLTAEDSSPPRRRIAATTPPHARRASSAITMMRRRRRLSYGDAGSRISTTGGAKGLSPCSESGSGSHLNWLGSMAVIACHRPGRRFPASLSAGLLSAEDTSREPSRLRPCLRPATDAIRMTQASLPSRRASSITTPAIPMEAAASPKTADGPIVS